jgi:hypothetical protein
MERMETNPWVIGLRSARANLIPGVILQGAAFALLAAYYWMPDVRSALDEVAGWQAQYGAPFAWASYLFFCGIVPYLFCMALPSLRPREPGKALLFALGFWSLMGLVLPQFYAFQGYLYGNAADFRTLALKVATDQCVYTAFFASPAVAVSHLWKDRGYRWSAVAPLFGKGWYRRLVIPNLVMNWVIWIPSLCVIYSLPLALQSHVAGLVGGFWALMSLQIAAHTQSAAPLRERQR